MAEDPIADATQFRQAPLPTALREAGNRAPVTDPVIVLEGACVAPYRCSVGDVNGDGKADIIRRAVGTGIEAALSNGWSFGPFRGVMKCPKGTMCTLANLDDPPDAEVLIVDADSNELAANEISFTNWTASPAPSPGGGAGANACSHSASYCRSFGFDGDAHSELGWIEDGDFLVADLDLGSSGVAVAGACGASRVCDVFDMNGSPGVELVSWRTDSAGGSIYDMELGKPVNVEIDCRNGQCDLADFDGDGVGDVVQWLGETVVVWAGEDAWQEPHELPWPPVWNPNAQTAWADANDDGYDDLFHIDSDGNLALHLNVDARGRLQAAALALSKLELQQARANRAFLAGGAEDTPAPTPTDAFEAERAVLIAEMDAAIASLIAAIPAEQDIETDEDVRWVNQLSMMAVAGRTVLNAGPLGASPRGNGCGNNVAHDVGNEGGGIRQSPSYLFSYAQATAVGDPQVRTPAILDALTAISGGFRCLNNFELEGVDRGFSDAVLETAAELHAAGHRLAPKWLVDNALPVALLTFDAVKYNTIPESYRLLSARFGKTVEPGTLPVPGFDFAGASDDPGCESFLCQTYGNDRRATPQGTGLMLDQLGIWLADPNRSGRLTAVEVDPRELLEGLLDLRNLGEGDCSLYEVVHTGFSCPSRRTCDAAQGIDGAKLDPFGDPLRPGMEGSELSHLLTPRDVLAEHNGCSDEGGEQGGGGGAAGACVGPALGGQQGRFSADPELDSIFRCTLRAGATPVDVSISVGDLCITGKQGRDGEPVEANPTDHSEDLSQEQQEALGNAVAKGATALRTGDSPATRRLAEDFLREYGTAENGLTLEDVLDAFAKAADLVEQAMVGEVHGGIGATHGDELEGKITVILDVQAHSDDLAAAGNPISLERHLRDTVVHEGVHVASMLLYRSHRIGHMGFRDHIVTRRNGLGQQCADGPCDASCGAGDSVFERFAECVDPGQDGLALDDVRCEYAEDVCSDRRLGDMGFPMDDECAPDLPETATNPECYVVQCGIDGGSLANACCASESSKDALPPLETVIGPGPRPPRPMFERLFDFDGFPVDQL